MRESILKKISFVDELSKVVSAHVGNINWIRYDVFVNVEDEDIVREYLVIEYEGGKKTYRNCTGNSCAAVFEEISKYILHCRDVEKEYYDGLLNNNKFRLYKEEA